MADLLALSARVIDSGVAEDPHNRITQELSEVADGVAVIESFSHVILLRTGEGLVAVDASGEATGEAVVASLRALVGRAGDATSSTPTATSTTSAAARPSSPTPPTAGHARPRVPGPRERPRALRPLRPDERLERRSSTGASSAGCRATAATASAATPASCPTTWPRPTSCTSDEHDRHRRRRCAWSCATPAARPTTTRGCGCPSGAAACIGDLFIWNFPNAGNPQKVQRYPEDWAVALRTIVAHEPELLLPAHGLPIAGAERIRRVLETAAGALETLVRDVLAMMNGGATLDEIVHTVRVDEALTQLPYLRPLYDEPEFVVRNVWRRYGGWWDGDPSHLKPAAGDGARGRAGDAGRRRRPAGGAGGRGRRRPATSASPATSSSWPPRPRPTTRRCTRSGPTSTSAAAARRRRS